MRAGNCSKMYRCEQSVDRREQRADKLELSVDWSLFPVDQFKLNFDEHGSSAGMCDLFSYIRPLTRAMLAVKTKCHWQDSNSRPAAP